MPARVVAARRGGDDLCARKSRRFCGRARAIARFRRESRQTSGRWDISPAFSCLASTPAVDSRRLVAPWAGLSWSTPPTASLIGTRKARPRRRSSRPSVKGRGCSLTLAGGKRHEAGKGCVVNYRGVKTRSTRPEGWPAWIPSRRTRCATRRRSRPDIGRRLVFAQPIDRVPEQAVSHPGQIGDLWDSFGSIQRMRDRTSGDLKRIVRGGGTLRRGLVAQSGAADRQGTLSGNTVPIRPS
jgi:hypothetical protein